ncbi:MAG: ABC transporter permease subunit [Gemmataceae bacterium]|nr:ABC transporter permease subunit [Gemmataceae bacterium]
MQPPPLPRNNRPNPEEPHSSQRPRGEPPPIPSASVRSTLPARPAEAPPLPPSRKNRYNQGWGNALFRWELLRAGRKISFLAIGRFIFGGMLLIAMWALWNAQYQDETAFKGDATQIQKELAQFSRNFSITFFMVQQVIVLLITPIFVAGAVFEERETRTGEVLLTTDLTRKEIFHGKLWARALQVLMVVAAGVPILALTLLWGGVPVGGMIVCYAVTLCTICTAAAVAAAVSADAETLRGGIFAAYGYLFVFDVLIFPASPFLMILVALNANAVGWTLCPGIFFIVVQPLVLYFSLRYGLRWLRLAMLRQRKRVTDLMATQLARPHPPIWENRPLLWKELYVTGRGEAFGEVLRVLRLWLIAYAIIMLLILAGDGFPTGWLGTWGIPLTLMLVMTSTGLSAASTIARERQKLTLIDLFMIPEGRRQILRAKWLGAFSKGFWPAVTLLFISILALFNGTSVLALPLIFVGTLVYTVFSTTLGLWLSVKTKNALTATTAWMLIMSLGICGTLLMADATSVRTTNLNLNKSIYVYQDWTRVVNPAMGIASLALDNRASLNDLPYWTTNIMDYVRPANLEPLTWTGLGLLIYALLSLFMWWSLCRHFEREGRVTD